MLSLVSTVLAQGTGTGDDPNVINLKPSSGLAANFTNLNVGQIIAGFITLVIVVAAVVFFIVLVIGGVRWIMSGGDKAQTEAARNQITAALVGLVIVFAAWAIAQLIGTFFGVSIFELVLPNIQNDAAGSGV